MLKFRKHIAIILAAYLVALMLLPCNDACAIFELHAAKSNHSEQNQQHKENDVCNPFCICDCCSTAMTIFNSPDINFVSTYSLHTFSIYEQGFLSKDFSAIWQPPKLG